MHEQRIIELEIKMAYQEDLIQSLNTVVAEQQMQLSKLQETCKLLHDKLKSLASADQQTSYNGFIDEKPPHY